MNEIERENYYREHPEELYGVEIELPPYEEWEHLPTPDEIDEHYNQIMKGVI